jgi:hypothetical protein
LIGATAADTMANLVAAIGGMATAATPPDNTCTLEALGPGTPLSLTALGGADVLSPVPGRAEGALRAAFAEAGVDLTRPAITTCGSGVTAAILSLALERLGHRNHALYDGSWAEWGMYDDLKVAKG